MKLKIILSLLLLTQWSFIPHADGARILGVFPMPANSHYILGVKLMKGLAEAGHDITFITPYKTQDIPKNGTWKDVHLKNLEKSFRESIKNANFYEDDSKRFGVMRLISYQDIMTHWVNETLYHPDVRALMTPDTKFDAVVMEQFMNCAHKYFAHYFQCPLILMSSVGPLPWVNNIVGNPYPPATIPHFFFTNDLIFQEMTFIQRFYNLFYNIGDYIFEYGYSQPLHNKLLQQAVPGAPSVSELNDYVSLVLLNGHVSLLDSVPLVPSMVEIGGYHIDSPSPLPHDLKEFINGAKDGIIYFSMGSNLKSQDMSEDRRKTFLNVFGKLKQKVIWKFEDEHLPGKPENVLIKKWLPQNDILAHPNVKLFITHGGFLSTTETIYHGVPLLAIPVFADQYMNANKAVQKGYGLKLQYSDENFNEPTLFGLIQELLNNPKYQKKAKEYSNIFHDRPLKPMENAVYWTEYIIRHNGAKHLRVEGAKLPLYKYLMLDVLAVFLTAIFAVFYAFRYIFSKIFCRPKAAKRQNKSKLL